MLHEIDTTKEPLPLLSLIEEIPSQKILFLDLDHTLFLGPFWSYVVPQIAQKVEGNHKKEEITAAIMRYSKDLLRTRSLGAYDWDVVVKKVLQEKFTYSWEKPIEEMIWEGISSSQLMDGAISSLQRAKSLGWDLIAASQGYRRYQEPVLEYLAISGMLSSSRFLEDTLVLKRHRDFYGLIPDGSLVAVLGDKYIDDVLYPENFGFAGIWYTGLYRDREVSSHLLPSAKIDHLDDLGETLNLIEKKIKPFRSPPEACLLCGGATRYRDDLCRLCLQVGWI